MKFLMEFARTCYRPRLHPSLRSMFRSSIGLSIKIRHRNKSTCSESNSVQRSR